MLPATIASLQSIVGARWVRHRRAELATYTMDGLPTRETVPGAAVADTPTSRQSPPIGRSSPSGKPSIATGAPSYDLRGTTRTMPPDAGAYVAGGGQADSLTPPTNVRIIK